MLEQYKLEVRMLAVGVSVTLGHPLCWFMLALGYLEPKTKDLHVCQWVKSWMCKKKMSVSLDTQLPKLC